MLEKYFYYPYHQSKKNIMYKSAIHSRFEPRGLYNINKYRISSKHISDTTHFHKATNLVKAVGQKSPGKRKFRGIAQRVELVHSYTCKRKSSRVAFEL